ncbi:hypothetical protein [Dyella sp. A6]|uniref:hypothetical protein n=1 Tax=Dyella aluminiiresistens TaxID=3069105 RepID=UPI002E75A10F|nr:hypothetical protein [Dyella sp. A6]
MNPKRKSTHHKRAVGVGERLYVNLPKSLARAIKQEAAARRITQTSIIESSLAERYDPSNADMRERMLASELRTVKRELAQVTFNQRATAEVLAVTVKNIVAMLPSPTAEGRKRAISFYNFMASEAAKALSSEKALVDRLAEKILTFSDEDFATVELPPGVLPEDEAALTFEEDT